MTYRTIGAKSANNNIFFSISHTVFKLYCSNHHVQPCRVKIPCKNSQKKRVELVLLSVFYIILRFSDMYRSAPVC